MELEQETGEDLKGYIRASNIVAVCFFTGMLVF